MSEYLFTNGSVLTMETEDRIALACGVSGGRIKGVGTADSVKSDLAGGYEEIDLKGGALLPGFVDSHIHFVLTAYFKMNMDLAGIGSLGELLATVRKNVSESAPGKWIMGLRFREDDYPEKRPPTKAELDEAAPDNPVILVRYDGHSAMMNSKVLEAAGLTPETPDPEGGRILRDANGLTGILQEKAVELALSAMPIPDREEFMDGQRQLTQKLLSYGITGLHGIFLTGDEGMSGPLGTFEVPIYKMFESELPFRNYPLVACDSVESAIRHLVDEFGAKKVDGIWRGGGIKLFADGTFGSRTAYLHEDFHDAPGEQGYMVQDLDHMRRVIFRAWEEGLQTAVHAIGDKAVSEVVRAHVDAMEKYGDKGLRHRIEHAGMIRRADYDGIRKAGIICSMQPTFILSEGSWIESRVGENRLRQVYPLRDLIDGNMHVCGGSDAPVEDPNVLEGVWATVVRNGFTPDQALSVYEGLSLYTSRAAYAAFAENESGTITPGKNADLIVLDKNPLAVPVDELRNIRVRLVMVGGRIVYEA